MSENACEINVSTGLENPEARIDDEGEPNVDTEEKVPPSLVNFFENHENIISFRKKKSFWVTITSMYRCLTFLIENIFVYV